MDGSGTDGNVIIVKPLKVFAENCKGQKKLQQRKLAEGELVNVHFRPSISNFPMFSV